MITGLLFLIFAGVNFSYYIVHANGKKQVRLYSSIILLGFAYAAFYRYIPNDPSITLLAFISAMDVIVDWRAKTKLRTGGH